MTCRRIALLGLLVALGALSGCDPAEPDREACLPWRPVVEPAEVRPGDTVTVHVAGVECNLGYPVGKTYALAWTARDYVRDLPTTPVAPDGSFATTFAVPSDAPAGQSYIRISGSPFDDCDDDGSCAGYGTSITVIEDVTTTVSPGRVPAAPTVESGPGGGSGEISVRWSAVAGATRYRVERADTPDGPFETAAELDVASGHADLGAGVVNLWSPSAGRFEYVEVVDTESGARSFRVVASDDAGDGPASAVVCGARSGSSGC